MLSGELADDLADAFEGVAIPVTVTRMIESGPPHNPTLTPEPHAGSGWLDDYKAEDANGTTITATSRRVMVLSRSLGAFAPANGDYLTILGATSQITAVRTDPGQAAWELTVTL